MPYRLRFTNQMFAHIHHDTDNPGVVVQVGPVMFKFFRRLVDKANLWEAYQASLVPPAIADAGAVLPVDTDAPKA
jgi:hypothetical protein